MRERDRRNLKPINNCLIHIWTSTTVDILCQMFDLSLATHGCMSSSFHVVVGDMILCLHAKYYSTINLYELRIFLKLMRKCHYCLFSPTDKFVFCDSKVQIILLLLLLLQPHEAWLNLGGFFWVVLLRPKKKCS